MSNNTRGARYWVGIWWPVALGILVIAIESTESFGADHTTGPLRALWQFFFGHVRDTSWEVIHHYIRKTGHFFGYGLIGVAWLRAWWMTLRNSKFWTDVMLAMLCTAVMASADEYHQSFLPNRTSSPWDVLLDCTGALILQLLVNIVVRITCSRKLAMAA